MRARVNKYNEAKHCLRWHSNTRPQIREEMELLNTKLKKSRHYYELGDTLVIRVIHIRSIGGALKWEAVKGLLT